MSMVWVNPVVASMYDTHMLDLFLRKHGYKRAKVSKDWGAVVKEKYREAVCQSEKTIADVRCPKVKALLEESEIRTDLQVPDIEPILIHCAREISEEDGEEKIIITPCQSLADMGNSLSLINTRFLTWNDFCKKVGEWPKGKKLVESPIPEGFFESLMLNTVSFTGEENIRQGLKEKTDRKRHIIEMLFCEHGCHNGDGVWMDEAR